METNITREAREELVRAVRSRYRVATSKEERRRMLAEFIAVTGYHPKSAIRVLHQAEAPREPGTRNRSRIYDQATRQALIVLWEASDRLCGKRLKPLLRTLLPALERHGHLRLDTAIREKVLSMSASTIDRSLRAAKVPSKKRRPTRTRPEVRQRIPVRTFGDWHNPDPGSMEMDLVAHCGDAARGSFVHTLVLTDIATGWTECAPLVVRESTLLVETLERVRKALPFELHALDTDNGSEFINESLVEYCAKHGIELTRSRPWLKNDQAWIEQKNGSVVRKVLGVHRYEGISATQCLGRLYTALRFFVNFFQTSFKLAQKSRDGASVTRRYHAPATPCERLLAYPSIPEATKTRLKEVSEMLDPIRLLEAVRVAQGQLVELTNGRPLQPLPPGEPDLVRFLTNLSTAWREGEVRPTHVSPLNTTRPTPPPAPHRAAMTRSISTTAESAKPSIPVVPTPAVSAAAVKTPVTATDKAALPITTNSGANPTDAQPSLVATPAPTPLQAPRSFVRRRKQVHAFVMVWPQISRWLDACPNMSAPMVLDQLQALYPGRFLPNQTAALERRMQAWRQVAIARGVVIGRRMYRASLKPRWWRSHKDSFEAVWPEVCQWLEADPDQTGTELMKRLYVKDPGLYRPAQLRTLQRRLKGWRAEAVQKLVYDLAAQPLCPGPTLNKEGEPRQ